MITRRGIIQGAGAASLVALNPSAGAAQPMPTHEQLLLAYSEWLHFERRLLTKEMWPGLPEPWKVVPCNTGVSHFWWPLNGEPDPGAPSSRAERVLRAAGADFDLIRDS